MTYSRVEKYKELREGLKDEAGINREKVVYHEDVEVEDDDFLSFIKQEEEKPVDLEDTLTEAKTFEQMRQESSKELEEALRSAKKGVGKESQYNTRMDILEKIKHPERRAIRIDAVDNYSTDEFAMGMFLNDESDNEETDETAVREDPVKPEVTQEFFEEEIEEELEVEEPVKEETIEFDDIIEQTREFEQVEEPVEDIEEDDPKQKQKDSKIVKVLDVLIVLLVIVLIVLLGIIVYQNLL